MKVFKVKLMLRRAQWKPFLGQLMENLIQSFWKAVDIYGRNLGNVSYFISQVLIWKFSLGINHKPEYMQKDGNYSIIYKSASIKLFIVEKFNIYKSGIGKWTPMCSSFSFNNDHYFGCLVFVKNFKFTRCLKIEQLNKLKYIYFFSF